MSDIHPFEIDRMREVLTALFLKHLVFVSRIEVAPSIGAKGCINVATFVRTPTAPLVGLGHLASLLAAKDSAFIDMTTGAINFYQVPVERLGPLWPR